jgi:hypothetical protein
MRSNQFTHFAKDQDSNDGSANKDASDSESDVIAGTRPTKRVAKQKLSDLNSKDTDGQGTISLH